MPAKRRDVRIKTQEDRLLWKLVGVALIAFAGFLVAALASYDPPPAVREDWQCGNLVGVVGNAFAQGAYWLFGFAAWCIPFAAAIGGLKMLAPIPKDVEEISNVRVGVRIAGLVLMALSVTGLFQLTGHWGWMRVRCKRILYIPVQADGLHFLSSRPMLRARGLFTFSTIPGSRISSI